VKPVDSPTVRVLVEGGQINVFVAFPPDVMVDRHTTSKMST